MAKNFSNFTEVGRSGLSTWGGAIQADFLRELRGKEGYKRYDEMRLNSPIIGGLLSAIEQRIRGVTWSYTSSKGENDPRVDLLERSMDNLSTSWNDHISEALTMLPFGFSLFEIVYERVGSEVMWRKFAIRGQDTIDQWLLDENGGLVGVIQRAAPSFQQVTIPIEKCILYRTRVERNNPEGRSILRNAWTSYYYATTMQQIEGIGVERDLAGFPVITLPQGATTDENDSTSDAAKAAKFVRNIRRDQQEGAVLPYGMKLELLSSGGSRQLDTNAIIQRYESRMLVSALAQFLLLGQNNVGTQALSQDQTEFFAASMDYVTDVIAEAHTKYAIPRLLALNGYDAEGISIQHTPAGEIDFMALSDALQKAGNKVTWTAGDEVWLRGVLGLPERTEEEIEEEKEANRKAAERAFEPQGSNDTNNGNNGLPGPSGGRTGQSRGDDEDQMSLLFAAEPYDGGQVMEKWDRTAKGVWRRFLEGQLARVEKAAKKTKAQR